MNIAQLFDNLSFKLKDQFFLGKNNAEKDKLFRHLTQTNHLSVQGPFFQIECNKGSLMDSEISSIYYQTNLFSLASLFTYVRIKIQ